MARTVAGQRRVNRVVVPRGQRALNARIRKVVKGAMEHKYAEAVAGAASQSSTATIAKITMPSQGDAFNNREGDEITFTSIRGRWNAIVADATNIVRYMLIKWLPDDAVEVPVVASILQSPVSVPWISQPVANRAAKAKFRVLYDSIANLSLAGTGQQIRTISIPGKRIGKVKFNAAALTGKGCIYLLTVSDSSVATHPTFSHEFIYKWIDQ